MAIFIPVTGAGLSRTTGSFLNPTGAFTFMYWAKRAASVSSLVGATYQTLTLLGTPDYSGAYIFTGSNFGASGSDFDLTAQNAAVTPVASTYLAYETPTIWYHVAVTFAAPSQFRFYINGWLVEIVTLSMAASSFTAERVGIETAASHGGFSFCHYRSWSATLTNNEIRLEMASDTAVKAASLFCATELPDASTLTDSSGNARDWTGTGAITTVDGPTMLGATNTNTAAADAYELNPLPTTQVQQCGNISSTIDVWFKLTWDDPETYVGVYGLGGGSGSGYVPRVKVYDGLTAALAQTPIYRGFNVLSSRPLTMPVFPGHVYYFFIDQTGNDSAPVLQISALLGPTSSIPSGSIAVNDDTDGLPLGILSSSTGDPITYVLDFPAGEDAHILPDGTLLVHGIGAIGGAGWFMYDANLVLLAGPISTGLTLLTENDVAASSNRVDTFYIMGTNAANTAFVGTTIDSSTYTASATLFHPTFKTASPPTLYAIAPSLDGTILYYSTSDEYIQRWDLVNDVALSDLAGPVTNYTTAGAGLIRGDILVMPDGSIVVGYGRNSTVATKIIVYETNGSIRSAYDYADMIYNRLAHDGANSTTMWVWAYSGQSGTLLFRFSIFTKINLTDGSVIQDTETVPQYRSGTYLTNPTFVMVSGGARPDPIRRFGHSDSCPFWITIEASPVPTPTYTVIEHPIRRLRRAPHLNNEHKRIFYPGFELEVQRGVGILADPGREPQIMLRVSRDGGQTWGSYMNMSAGALGAYKARPRVQRLGTSRDMAFEITTTDPNDFEVINAWLTPDPQPGEN